MKSSATLHVGQCRYNHTDGVAEPPLISRDLRLSAFRSLRSFFSSLRCSMTREVSSARRKMSTPSTLAAGSSFNFSSFHFGRLKSALLLSLLGLGGTEASCGPSRVGDLGSMIQSGYTFTRDDLRSSRNEVRVEDEIWGAQYSGKRVGLCVLSACTPGVTPSAISSLGALVASRAF